MTLRYTIVAVLLALGVVLPASAVVSTATGGVQTDATDGIELAPSTGPNGQYATVSDGELALHLEGLNDRAVTRADDVFTITVTDEAVESVWIEHDVAGVTFYRGSDPTDTVTASNPLTPAADETTRIGVAIDTHVVTDATETFTIHVQYDDRQGFRPGVILTEFTVTPTTVETSENVTVRATYRNGGRNRTAATSRLTVDGTVVDRQSFALEPGETEAVVFERSMDWPGTYEVGVDGTASRTVTVQGSGVEIVDARVDATSRNNATTTTDLTVGESATIRATVRNPTDARVERTLELAVDGIVVDSWTVSVPADAERTVTFERRFDDAGSYEVSVSGVTAGTITVSEPLPVAVLNRNLSAATTAALAPPTAAGVLVLLSAANRRWAIVR